MVITKLNIQLAFSFAALQQFTKLIVHIHERNGMGWFRNVNFHKAESQLNENAALHNFTKLNASQISFSLRSDKREILFSRS